MFVNSFLYQFIQFLALSHELSFCCFVGVSFHLMTFAVSAGSVVRFYILYATFVVDTSVCDLFIAGSDDHFFVCNLRRTDGVHEVAGFYQSGAGTLDGSFPAATVKGFSFERIFEVLGCRFSDDFRTIVLYLLCNCL